MKKILKRFIEKFDSLVKLRYGRMYRSARDKSFKEYITQQDDFYRKLLGASHPLIFDIGANIGDHTDIFRHVCKQVICVEPDATNYRILKARFPGKRVTILRKAVSDKNGIAEFHIESEGSAYNTLSEKWVTILEDKDLTRYDRPTKFVDTVQVETVTLDNLIQQYGKPDFIKIDVEGFELAVIKGLTQAVPLIAIECNLPEFLDETLAIIAYLNNLDNRYVFNYGGEHQFYLDEYVPAEKMLEIIRTTDFRFLELYARLDK